MKRVYPYSYHAAIAHLVHFGPYCYSAKGRALCARALRDLRKVSRDLARHEQRHMIYICGHMPTKGSH